MSGHSKWANIRIRKGAQDAKRGKIYTRHARLIEMAARTGGGDPLTNNTLKHAIENAKTDSVPNANIERAILKGTGELKGEAIAEILYAAMGPSGTAILIECLSDNRNRTINNVRSKVEKHGGRWTEVSSVQWMFSRKGVVVAKLTQSATAPLEILELTLIDAGAEDIDVSDDTIAVTTSVADWPKIRAILRDAGSEILSAGLQFVPTQKVPIHTKEEVEHLHRIIEMIEEDDDVSAVHTNADIAEDVLKAML